MKSPYLCPQRQSIAIYLQGELKEKALGVSSVMTAILCIASWMKAPLRFIQRHSQRNHSYMQPSTGILKWQSPRNAIIYIAYTGRSASNQWKLPCVVFFLFFSLQHCQCPLRLVFIEVFITYFSPIWSPRSAPSSSRSKIFHIIPALQQHNLYFFVIPHLLAI